MDFQNGSLIASCKIPEFSKKSPLSGAEKHPDFQVTVCLHFVTTNVDFVYIESEYQSLRRKRYERRILGDRELEAGLLSDFFS